jgi:hypothetical protein
MQIIAAEARNTVEVSSASRMEPTFKIGIWNVYGLVDTNGSSRQAAFHLS